MMVSSVKVEGLDRIIRKLSPELIGVPLRKFFERSSIQVQSEGRRRTVSDWHDTGQTAASIVYEVDDRDVPLWAKVGWLRAAPGTPLWFKARAGEFGTGRVGDPEVNHMSGHWPPGEALGTWAHRHGFASGHQVARIIGTRGGIRPRRMLRSGLESSLSAIRGFFSRLGGEVKERWDRR